jgi:hypothetical protein
MWTMTKNAYLTERDQVLGVQPGIRVSFQAARGPRQVDEEPIEDLARIGSGRTIAIGRPAELVQVASHRRRQVGIYVGAIGVEQRSPVAHGRALHQGAADEPLHLPPRIRDPGRSIDRGFNDGGFDGGRNGRQVSPRGGLPLGADPAVRRQPGEVALQRPPGERGTRGGEVLDPHPLGMPLDLSDELVVHGRGNGSRHLEPPMWRDPPIAPDEVARAHDRATIRASAPSASSPPPPPPAPDSAPMIRLAGLRVRGDNGRRSPSRGRAPGSPAANPAT